MRCFGGSVDGLLVGALGWFFGRRLGGFRLSGLGRRAGRFLGCVLSRILGRILRRVFGLARGLGAGRLASGGFGGFLARFLGHTPSFRRFRRINQ